MLNCPPKVPFKPISKLLPLTMSNVPLLFNIALVPITPDPLLAIVIAPELFHTAPVPSVKPPVATETLPEVASVPSRVPPVHEKLLVIAPPTISSVPPANASVPAPLIVPPLRAPPPDNVKLVPVARLIAPELFVAPETVKDPVLRLTVPVPVLVRLARVYAEVVVVVSVPELLRTPPEL